MSLVQDDHVIQAFATDTPDEPLNVWILPRAAGGGYHFFDSQVPHPLPKGGAVDTVPIVQEIPRSLVPWERVNDLLGGPRCSRVRGDVDMDETSSLVGQDEQGERHVVGERRHDKEIQGRQILHVVFQEGLPRR